MKYEVSEVSLEEVLPIRSQVLWPNHPIDFVRMDTDSISVHVGAKDEQGRLVGVGSLVVKSPLGRIRKVAVLPECQHQGIGTEIIMRLVELGRQRDLKGIWLGARLNAAPFYEKCGFKIAGESYTDPESGQDKAPYKIHF
eukprot:Blabericola_migrator_1__4687@NODE_2476_length_2706_cov_139_369458_g1544_i1_p4_GENE_NODE_2476_length_2706_cov_139_369458_g1544_i1NODE_2476_length_2706_cov_139_369458_g1544_i1_p4_ORF_typecomplete_len140_score26_17Acetyltransf_10/PF13673_7/7e19Acetyltransf_1/PF00583_25/1_8e15Acetyltransf_7/PF13508_7/3_3e10Acetyltransf_9/PF13527_7/6_5e08NodA/PF02474_15/2_3e05GNAT_acetyltran/PF12746_7/0_00021Acetyltransf_4/PF13420_7/0_00034FR47/PF08445_10/0_00089GNAT_acetyltr_2/PF13718_6/0_0013Acetyltransf_3/PF13302_